MKKKLQSIEWNKKHLVLLDQRRIPEAKEFIQCSDLDKVIECIQKMIIRGAPGIAISGLFGLVLELKNYPNKIPYEKFLIRTNQLIESRPTAVNLKLAVEEFLKIINQKFYESTNLKNIILTSENFAISYFQNDLKSNLAIGNFGTELFLGKSKTLNIITHCNTGALATAGHGTAIGIIRSLRDKGYKLTVYASETRPYQQGSRLTAWEMKEENIECYIIAEGMSSWLMNTKKIDAVIVGADRIASNGDTANKIGTSTLAIISREYSIPFYVAATKTSFDFKIKTGKEIPIEMRNENELTQNSFLKNSKGNPYIPEGVLSPIGAKALNPSFDITNAKYISAIITEKGIIKPVNQKNILKVLK